VAAGEDEPQLVIGDFFVLGRFLRHVVLVGDLAPTAAQTIDRLEPAGRHEPGPRIRRNAVNRPPLDRGCERFLNRLLGEIEVAEETDQSGENAA